MAVRRLQPTTGQLRRRRGVTISPPGVNGFADGVAYAHTKYGDAYALDLTTGALIWQYNFGSPSISTAALSGTNLVLGDGGGTSTSTLSLGRSSGSRPGIRAP